MNIDEAIEILSRNLCKPEGTPSDEFEATVLLIQQYHFLRKQVTELATESVKRDLELAKIEAEVKQAKEYFGKKDKVIEKMSKEIASGYKCYGGKNDCGSSSCVNCVIKYFEEEQE